MEEIADYLQPAMHSIVCADKIPQKIQTLARGHIDTYSTFL